MSNYLMKYKGKYRILPKLDLETNDIPRNIYGEIAEGYDDLYISCQYGNEIYVYGCDASRRMWLEAYIPSIGRGRNIVREIKRLGIEYSNLIETDEEVMFRFKAKDIEQVAVLLRAKVNGAGISPFSTKNLPKNKTVSIPTEKNEAYKKIISVLDSKDLLIIHRVTIDFLTNILEKNIKKRDKKFNYKTDMKKLMMGRQTKEYIYYKGMWDEYLSYLKKNLCK